MKYVYVLKEDIFVLFESSKNQVAARQEAEQAYGHGGELFREVPKSPPPEVGVEVLSALHAPK